MELRDFILDMQAQTDIPIYEHHERSLYLLRDLTLRVWHPLELASKMNSVNNTKKSAGAQTLTDSDMEEFSIFRARASYSALAMMDAFS
jgi:hypothetical protein